MMVLPITKYLLLNSNNLDMKRVFISSLLAILCVAGYSQKFKTSSSSIRFFSDAPIEDIEATNKEATSIIDLESKAFVFQVPITSFKFDKELMEEHFNENYLESEKFPNAIFKGKIENWNGEEGEQTIVVEGELDLHGVKKLVTIESTINYSADNINVSAVFSIELKDYKIKIPKAVFYNIAEVVEVTVNFEYTPL